MLKELSLTCNELLFLGSKISFLEKKVINAVLSFQDLLKIFNDAVHAGKGERTSLIFAHSLHPLD